MLEFLYSIFNAITRKNVVQSSVATQGTQQPAATDATQPPAATDATPQPAEVVQPETSQPPAAPVQPATSPRPTTHGKKKHNKKK